MTVSEALAILESATLECQKRDINTPEVMEALNLLEPHIQPPWLIPQFRYHLDRDPSVEVYKEIQQQALRATFPGIRDSVKELLSVRMDAVARKFHETRDMAVKDEFESLLKEYGKLTEPWLFVSKTQKEI
jgi:hypothetical protein